MVVGDDKKFLSCIITLKVNQNMKEQSPTYELTNECKIYLKDLIPEGDKIKTV